ncbi:glycosyltransferase family 2 protein [Sediminimonas sp.]|uniref:glycosyltransferase family 2 protein n=1 Tax=Sediminimonas sp. TaxID=2823379 RepID=UPI0025D97237|nr:glycosyltransferase family 2 protein [Sediminimonas sp.]
MGAELDAAGFPYPGQVRYPVLQRQDRQGKAVNRVELRALAGRVMENGAGVLDMVRMPPRDGMPGLVRIFFTPETEHSAILPEGLGGVVARGSIGGCLVADMEHAAEEDAERPLRLPIRDCDATMVPAAPETELFAGLNCAVAQRNGESVETVRDWLIWHRRVHDLQAALIIERAHPEHAQHSAEALRAALDAAGADGLTVVILTAPVPLGQSGTGPERHPMNAPDAPGKDRMEQPECDRWSAPLAALSIYELLRYRFLARARAVMNIDVHDLLPRLDTVAEGVPDQPVFDRAAAAPEGLVALSGERIYPWGVRKGRAPVFGDHICRRFDRDSGHGRWCVAPARLPEGTAWRMVRVTGARALAPVIPFWRCMALRYGASGAEARKISRIVPKSSLIEDAGLLAQARELGAKPLRMPEANLRPEHHTTDRVAIVTTMKNEGPFIIEWLAYHRAIGVDDFLIYTNDCDDGTDTLLELLQDKGLVQHRDNPFRQLDLKPQHAALAAAEDEPMIARAGWMICMDVDEFINIHAGEGHLRDLFAAAPEANMISLTWRLFGNSDIAEYRDGFITEQFTRCAPQMARKPHQAWGFKTLFRNLGIFKKLGVHRPKGLRPQLKDQIAWVNGSGQPMPETEYRNAWRSTTDTVGYDLVTLNHYALRSAESFLVKRDRGRVNHVDRDQGLAYWFRMNNNAEEDRSIQRMLPALRAEYDRLMSDPEIAAAHAHCVARHRARIDALKAAPKYAAFYADLIGARLRALSRLHGHFGAGVFLAGPDVIPDEVWQRELPDDFFFTVQKGQTSH